MKVFVCLLALCGLGFALPTGQVAANKKVVCYFGSWSVYRHGNGKFDVEDIDPRICTHVMYGFTGLNANNEMVALDEYNDLEENWGKGAMKRFTRLRQQNPELKAILAVGGWNEGSEKYSRMARTAESRRTFINSVLPFLESQEFDGLDVDWEYPANREGSNPEDRENFIHLLTELREEFDKRGYLLTAAVSAGVNTIATAYDIPAMSKLLDFISVMAYDFHGAWEKFTGHHAALGGNPSLDLGANFTLNANYSIRYWIENGAAPEKLVLGMGAYGRGFILDDVNQNGLYAPASQAIDAGPYTGTAGFWGYNEIVEKMNAQQGQWTERTEPTYEAPYAFNGRNWIGYDSQASVIAKARFIKELGLGGGMMWSIDTDDFKGFKDGETFKLTKTLYRELNGELPPPPPTTTEDPNNPRTTTTTTAAPPPPGDVCQYVGLNPDPNNDCTDVYYNCYYENGRWVSLLQRCPAGIVFNPDIKNCDYRENVEGCQN